MDFGATVSRAVRIAWDYKVLWILGFLAALSGGGAGNIAQSPQTAFRFSGGEAPPWMQELANNPNALLAGASAFACLVLILSVVLLIVGIIARGGLIAGVQQIETDGTMTFGRAWSAGAARFWRLLGLNILLWLPFVILIIIMIAAFGGAIFAAVVASSNGAQNGRNGGAIASLIGGSIIVLCCFICVIIVYALLAMTMQTFGERAIVLENTGVTAGLSRAWTVFRANLGNVILLALLMLVISIVFGLITSAIVLAILAPTMIPLFNELGQGGVLSAATTILAAVGVVVATILGAIINTLFVTFNSTTWTLAYRQFTGAAPSITTTPAVQPPLPAA